MIFKSDTMFRSNTLSRDSSHGSTEQAVFVSRLVQLSAHGFAEPRNFPVTMTRVPAQRLLRDLFAGKESELAVGLAKSDWKRNKKGKIVSAVHSANGGKNAWILAVVAARKALNVTGFVAIVKGSPLHTRAKQILAAWKKHELM